MEMMTFSSLSSAGICTLSSTLGTFSLKWRDTSEQMSDVLPTFSSPSTSMRTTCGRRQLLARRVALVAARGLGRGRGRHPQYFSVLRLGVSAHHAHTNFFAPFQPISFHVTRRIFCHWPKK